MSLYTPTRIATTESSAVMPMTTPSTVRKDRILFSRSVVSAICAFSPRCMCIATFKPVAALRWPLYLAGQQLLPAVDVVGPASERRVGHDVHGKRGDVGWSHDTPYGKRRTQLLAT